MLKIRISIKVIKEQQGEFQYDYITLAHHESEITPADWKRRSLNFFHYFVYTVCDMFIKVLADALSETKHYEGYTGPVEQHEVTIKSESEHDARKFVFNSPDKY